MRDAAHRGYSAADTIKRWQSVRWGEKNYIFPHQNNANVFFNSALAYELSVLKTLAQPLLLQVEPGTEERIEANRLLAFFAVVRSYQQRRYSQRFYFEGICRWINSRRF